MTNEEFSAYISSLLEKKDNLSIFERNILAMTYYSALLAKEILEVKKQKFKTFMSSDPIDINIVASDGSAYLYNEPAKEITEQLVKFEEAYSRYNALFIYGLGNGVFIKALLGNESHKNIVVFEPELEIIYIVLNIIDFSKDFFTNRLLILNTKFINSSHYYALVKMEPIFNSARLYNLYVNCAYYEKFTDDMREINTSFTEAMKQRLREIGNDSKDALIGIKHTTKHMPLMLKNIALSSIKKQRKSKVKTAIIVSTGPSLNKQLPLLKKLQKHATIISIDASYPILKQHDIKPDFVTSIERVVPTSKFFDSKVSKFDENIIFMLASLIHDSTIENMKGRNYALVLRPLNYESGFKDYDFGYLGTGQSAAHFAFDLAVYLKHKKIILIGQDLAFGEDDTSHASGHIYKDTQINPKTVSGIEYAPAYYGEGKVKSTDIWNAFRQYFENLVAIKKEDYTPYNCTEGGAKIKGFIQKPFKEMAEEILKETKPNFNIPAPLSEDKQKAKIRKYSKRLKSTLNFGDKMQKQAERLFLQLARQVERAKKLKAKNQADKINYEKLQNLANKISIFKEKINDMKFKTTYYTMACSFIHNQELEFAVILARPSDTMEEKKEKLFEWVSVQGYWLFTIAGILSITNENLRECAKEWIVE